MPFRHLPHLTSHQVGDTNHSQCPPISHTPTTIGAATPGKTTQGSRCRSHSIPLPCHTFVMQQVLQAPVGHEVVHQDARRALRAVPVEPHEVRALQPAQHLHLRLELPVALGALGIQNFHRHCPAADGALVDEPETAGANHLGVGQPTCGFLRIENQQGNGCNVNVDGGGGGGGGGGRREEEERKKQGGEKRDNRG